jgi:hypothetical protein
MVDWVSIEKESSEDLAESDHITDQTTINQIVVSKALKLETKLI